jgi:hypothetical protein
MAQAPRPRSRRATPYSERPPFPSAQFLEDPGDALVLVVKEGLELGAALERVGPALVGEGLLPLRGGVHLGDQVDVLLGLGLAQPGRADDAAPVGELQVDAQALEGRRVDTSHRLSAGDGEDLHVAGLGLLGDLADAGGGEGDLLAQDAGEQLAAAVVGHVVDVLGGHADGLGQQHRGEVVRATGVRGTAHGHLARVGLPGGDELVEGVVRRALGDDDRLRLLDQLRDRHGVVEGGLRLVRVDGPDDAEPHLHEDVVLALLVDEPLQSDGATGTSGVEDLDGLGELGVLHGLRREAGRGVVAAAGGVRDEDPKALDRSGSTAAGVGRGVVRADAARREGEAGDGDRGDQPEGGTSTHG